MKKQTIIMVIVAVIAVLAIAIGVAVSKNQNANGESVKIETASQMKKMLNSIYAKLKDELPSLEIE